MPPKVKPLPTKPIKKDMAAASAKPPPPAVAAATATSFSIDAEDPLTAHCYAEGAYDYADVVFRVNGTMQKSEYQVRVAEDGLSVLFVRAISSMSFDKRILHKIMGAEYHESSSRVVAGKRGVWHVQCNCIMIVTVRKAEERTQAELEVATSYVDLFGIESSQSQRSDDPPSPPRRCKKRRSDDNEDRHAVDDNIDDNDNG
jgi:hypothetical protein